MIYTLPKTPNNKAYQQGFTLIELLIVIVIIGILAGIIIMVLDPARQRNRAKDAVIIATMNKVATEIRAYQNSDISGNAALPDCPTLVSNLKNASPAGAGGATDCNGSGVTRIFTVTGVTNATGVPVTIYYRPYATGDFCLAARAVNVDASGNFLRMRTSVASEGTPIKFNYLSGAICP